MSESNRLRKLIAEIESSVRLIGHDQTCKWWDSPGRDPSDEYCDCGISKVLALCKKRKKTLLHVRQLHFPWGVR